MPEEPEDVEAKSSDSPEVYQQTRFMECFEKAFPWLLCVGAALGLILMIVIPNAVFQEKSDIQIKAQSDLRLAILYTTGGMIAALGLLETYRKNTNDRTKANADIKAADNNQRHQTEVLKEQIRQFDDNAFKERKAERRERYTKAVEQLGNEKAPIRIGGVYTLVGLVDEWLEEKNLEYSEQLKEGQVIINNLCAYIRSPYTLASRYDELSQDKPTGSYEGRAQAFYADKAMLKSEADVRLSIINQIHKNVQWTHKNNTEKSSTDYNENKIHKGVWSNFEYNFSGSVFFYNINFRKSYWEKKLDISNSKFLSSSKYLKNSKISYFNESIYNQGVCFRNCTHKCGVEFSDSVYRGEANFGESSYEGYAAFNNSTYYKLTSLDYSVYNYGFLANYSTYHKDVYFHDSIYKDIVSFGNSKYYKLADFSNSIYLKSSSFTHSTYESKADFHNSIYYGPATFGEHTTYNNETDFSDSIYYSEVLIGASFYKLLADFRNSIYIDRADFSFSRFKDTCYFDGSVFLRSAYFLGSICIKYKPRFIHDYSIYTNLDLNFYPISTHITLFPSTGNNFEIFLQEKQVLLDVSDILERCKFINYLATEQKEKYNNIMNKVSRNRDNFDSLKTIQEKEIFITYLKNIGTYIREWQQDITTIIIQNNIEISDQEN